MESSMSPSVLILPGIGKSDSQHWQSLWERSNSDFERIQQRDWDNPICEEWIATLEDAVKSAGAHIVIVAHSLGCLAVAHWAAQTHSSIKAALLVGVPDPAGSNFPKEAIGFSVTPTKPFDFPSIVVASTDDPYATIEYTSHLAKAWGSKLVNIGAYGHINANSGLGVWAEGYELLTKLRG